MMVCNEGLGTAVCAGLSGSCLEMYLIWNLHIRNEVFSANVAIVIAAQLMVYHLDVPNLSSHHTDRSPL